MLKSGFVFFLLVVLPFAVCGSPHRSWTVIGREQLYTGREEYWTLSMTVKPQAAIGYDSPRGEGGPIQ